MFLFVVSRFPCLCWFSNVFWPFWLSCRLHDFQTQLSSDLFYSRLLKIRCSGTKTSNKRCPSDSNLRISPGATLWDQGGHLIWKWQLWAVRLWCFDLNPSPAVINSGDFVPITFPVRNKANKPVNSLTVWLPFLTSAFGSNIHTSSLPLAEPPPHGRLKRDRRFGWYMSAPATRPCTG